MISVVRSLNLDRAECGQNNAEDKRRLHDTIESRHTLNTNCLSVGPKTYSSSSDRLNVSLRMARPRRPRGFRRDLRRFSHAR
jgi:hypothetical protein